MSIKKAIKLITAYMMIVCAICGCAGKYPDKAADANLKSDTAYSVVSDAADDADEGLDGTSNEKPAYEYTPNIVDDNYRNYYEIFVGSFYDSDGDGCGDLAGIGEKLDYISELGCNGIWLTPIMEAPSYHKYDTTDFYSVDPAFGTNEDFVALADACHAKGIRLIIDLVINHSSSEHPWFKEACEYLRTLPEGTEPDISECPYVDYYHFSREKENSSYCEVPGCDWYYEAVFNYTQPDLNLNCEALIDELEDIARFWIDMGCDGFRMDAAMHYDDSSASFNIDFLHDYYSYCRTLDPDFYMVSEVWASKSTIADYYASETPSFFNFDVAGAEGKLIRAGRGKYHAEKFVRSCVDYQETFGSANPEYIDAPFITNHDMVRAANTLMNDPVSMKMTAGLLLTMSGSPFIYYGEEIGMNSKGQADENKRLHMNWSSTERDGLCKDPVGADSGIVQSMSPADEQESDPDSVYSYYKEALAIRNAYPEIARGTIEIEETLTGDDIAIITKTWDNETIAIAYNTSDEAKECDLTGSAIERMALVGDLEADMSGYAFVSSANGQTVLTIPGRSIVFLK